MLRTQVQLTQEQNRRLKGEASELGVSVAELVRRCIDEHLGSQPSLEERWARADEFIGELDDVPDPPTDLAQNHDRWSAEGW